MNKTEFTRELLRAWIEREIDAELEAWMKNWRRGHRGIKPTLGLKCSWYRIRLVSELLERRSGGG